MTATNPAAQVARHCVIPQPGSRTAVDLRADIAVTLPPLGVVWLAPS